ncbi:MULTISPECIES: leucyl aminopeptidase [unclassified Roseofilum]|uniref:leucyl aminopeptidase n=1 Tax=unclassified Roseofilum TaxID=2620099 RepID=UPI000E8671EA|nr:MULTISPECIES: leucyl aminopeptidase [unclassified Roseofilum]MBP0010264.1 leucyl aminopeptidase [Roseofilum sp. Belize Diploria]MBP0034988.1 leucyl aminopeptidase [Roseofilum sp. Belize BBD 4]HBQ98110.1 leucyl aminopeptidase [Cyanobacteria bacterium UBA11691]
MEFKPTDTPRLDWTGDALALGFFEDAVELSADLGQLDEKLDGALAEFIEDAEFKGKDGSTIFTRLGKKYPIRKLILLGLGKAEKLSVETLRQGGASAAKLAQKERCQSLGLSFPLLNDDRHLTAQAIAEGIELGLHQDNRFKSEPEEKPPELQTVALLGLGGTEAALEKATIICSGVILARELVAAPANEVTPITLAETAQAIASEYGLELEILGQKECEEQGMGAFLGVAQASDLPPQFIHLTYKPQGTPRRKLAIVGKGLTFDSGGLNIKAGAGSSIEMMKTDMGGAGATLGAAKAIAQLKPDVEVHFISAATENMISGHAMHPGDILKASNGKTIEVNNTDAEGRLTLADALVFAEKLGVEAIVDLATLTGACVVALGNKIGGLWTADDTLAADFINSSELAGEQFWRMPLEETYFDSMKSVVADMKNAGSRAGGSISAALFLKQFIKETPWIHLDIAGPVWTDKDYRYHSAGATGFPVRSLVNWVLS